MNINEYMEMNHKGKIEYGEYRREITPPVVCKDGFVMSVQVGDGLYCSPRDGYSKSYDEMEIGYPSRIDRSLLRYAEEPKRPTRTVYGYVPVEVIDEVISNHGGFETDEKKIIEGRNRFYAAMKRMIEKNREKRSSK